MYEECARMATNHHVLSKNKMYKRGLHGSSCVVSDWFTLSVNDL